MKSSASRSFMMGQFEATFPSELQYTTNHMWALRCDSIPNRYRFGLTSYAVRLLQDVYFLDVSVEPEMKLARRQMLGAIESKKAESDLYSPTAGVVDAVNAAVINDPSLINTDIYGAGWMFELSVDSIDDLLSVDQYLIHLNEAWVVAQRTIKGQI